MFLDQQWNWLSNMNKTVEFWHETEPQNDDPDKMCSYLASTYFGEWYSSPCNHQRPYVCKMAGEKQYPHIQTHACMFTHTKKTC